MKTFEFESLFFLIYIMFKFYGMLECNLMPNIISLSECLVECQRDTFKDMHDWSKPREIMDKSHMRVAHHILSAKEFQGYFSEELK